MKKNSSYKLICSSMRPSVYNRDSFSHVTERPYYLSYSHAASLPWKAIHFQAPHIIPLPFWVLTHDVDGKEITEWNPSWEWFDGREALNWGQIGIFLWIT